MIPLLYCC